MRLLIVHISVLMLLASVGRHAWAYDSISSAIPPETVVCDIVSEHDYKMGSYMASYADQSDHGLSDERAWVVEEYNVLYNLAQMPAGYEIPTVLKAFALDNKIKGVEIVPNVGDEFNQDMAALKKTDDGRIVLTVSDSIADKPKKIMRRLLGINDSREHQGNELHGLVGVTKEDKGWNARFAKTVQKGVDKLTGRDIGTKINYKRVRLEPGGSFDDLFAKKQTTLTLKGHPRFDIELQSLDTIIPLAGESTESLVLFASILNQEVDFSGELYFSDTGALYSCHSEN